MGLWKTAFKGRSKVDGYRGKPAARSKTNLSTKNTSRQKIATISLPLTQAIVYRLSRPIWVIDEPDFTLVEMETHSIGGSTYRTAVKWQKGSTVLQVAVMDGPARDVSVPVKDIMCEDPGMERSHSILWMPQLFKSDPELDANLPVLADEYTASGELSESASMFIVNDHLYCTRSDYDIEEVKLVPAGSLGLTPGMSMMGYNGANVDDSYLDTILRPAPASAASARPAAASRKAASPAATTSHADFFTKFKLPWETPLEPVDELLIPEFDPGEVEISQDLQELAEMIYEEHGSKYPVRNFLFYGEGGAGKSTDAKLLAQSLGLPYRFLNLSLNAEEGHLVGMYKPQEDGTFRFDTTPFLEAAERGGVIEIVELNYGKPGVLGILNSFMDRTGKIIAENGDIIERHPNCIIVATTNVGYAGCLPVNLALKDRFDEMREVKKLPKDALMRIVKREANFDDEAMISKLIDAVEKMALKIKQDEIDGLCSTRQLINWARKVKFSKDPKKAAWKTVLPGISLDTDVQEEFYKKILEPIF